MIVTKCFGMKRDNRQQNNGKNRGYYQNIYDKYMNSARDCNVSGDKVMAEYNMQYAEHYLRLINERFPLEKRLEQKTPPRNTEVCTIQISSAQNQQGVLIPELEIVATPGNEELEEGAEDSTKEAPKKKRRYYKKQSKSSEATK